MDIYAELKNFSFYENSGAIYITVKILEKNILQTPHQNKAKFIDAQVGDTISLKTDSAQIKEAGFTTLEKLANLLLNRFLIFHVIGWEAATTGYKNSCPKFLFSHASKPCAILTAK